ncbi:MAG: hypothetical protein WCK90_01710 [archaeon]
MAERKKYFMRLHLESLEGRERVTDMFRGFIYATHADGYPIAKGHSRRFEEAEQSMKLGNVRTAYSDKCLEEVFNEIQSEFATPMVGDKSNPLIFRFENRQREGICARFLEYAMQ